MEDPTLLIHWLFSVLTLGIICTRLAWGRVVRGGFNLGDYLSMAAGVCAMTRLGMIHVVLTWGTNNMSAAFRRGRTFGPEEIYRREVGSKLAVANRVFYNSYLWLQKLVLFDIVRRLFRNVRFETPTIWGYLVIFFGAYVAVQVTTFSECNPFHLYWQVVPDPGPCSKAQLQLVVVGVLNVVTDLMLLVLPLPLIFSIKTPWRRKAQLLVLFGLGIFVIAITIIRLPINSFNADSQVSRTTWASTELLTAAVVVNAPTLYGLWNHHRQRRRAQRHAAGADPSSQHPEVWTPSGPRSVGAPLKRSRRSEPLDEVDTHVELNDDEQDAAGYPMSPVSPNKEPIAISVEGHHGAERDGADDRSSNLDHTDRASSNSSQRGILKGGDK